MIPYQVREKWINKCKGLTINGISHPYHKAASLPDQECERVWKETLTAVGSNQFLRTALMKMSASAEAHISMRQHFGRSLACLSMCHYVLGIGDRHQSNFMVDQVTGDIVGIDFGHAFGSATTMLPVPELQPFRLTPQIEGVFYPHGSCGMLRGSMGHTLRVLQGKKDVLLATMAVFVNEPLLDWEINVKKDIVMGRFTSKETASIAVDENIVTQYALAKLDGVRNKLDRRNPISIMDADLRHNFGAKAHAGVYSAYSKAIQGTVCSDASSGVGDLRAQIKFDASDRCPDVLTQVDCLIDLASDPKLLVRAWAGWEPWF